MIRNIIFDWSGTLVDDLPAVLEATNHVLARAGAPAMTADQFRAEFCLPFERFYRRILPETAPARIEEWFHERFRDIRDDVRELPHARAFLEFCRIAQVRLFLLSTLHQSHFDAQSAGNGFGRYFEKAYVEVMDKRERIAGILLENGLDPSETLLVGDMQHDIEAARRGGVKACATLTGYNTLDQLRESGPDLIVEHLGELRDLLLAGKFEFGAPAGAKTPEFPISTVGALIYNAPGEVLMIRTRKWSDLWGIPGGKIKYGETALEALHREVFEETALTLEETRFVTVQDCVESPEFYRRRHFLLLNYTARAVEPAETRLNEEATEFKWVSPEEAARMPLNRPTRVLLEMVSPRASHSDSILIRELAVSFHVGVPDEERAQPQRLLLNVELTLDVSKAAAGDALAETVNYYEVAQRLLHFGEGRSWKLIETLACDAAEMILRDFLVRRVSVEVQKFIIPETRCVAVRIERSRPVQDG